MSIIAITCLSNGKITVTTCMCTQEEYNIYMSDISNEINEYSFSSEFVKRYLTDLKIDITTLDELSGQVGAGKYAVWQSSIRTISLLDLKELLKIVKLPYDDFIVAYAERLKSL